MLRRAGVPLLLLCACAQPQPQPRPAIAERPPPAPTPSVAPSATPLRAQPVDEDAYKIELRVTCREGIEPHEVPQQSDVCHFVRGQDWINLNLVIVNRGPTRIEFGFEPFNSAGPRLRVVDDRTGRVQTRPNGRPSRPTFVPLDPNEAITMEPRRLYEDALEFPGSGTIDVTAEVEAEVAVKVGDASFWRPVTAKLHIVQAGAIPPHSIRR